MLVAGAGIAVGSGGLALLLWGNPPPAAVVATGNLPPTPAIAVAEPQLSAPAPAVAAPVRVDMPSISLSSSLMELHVQNDGTLEVPPDPATAGWWSDGPAPGDPGAAIIVGHVDSLHGPAAFYRLSGLHPGDKVLIHRADQTVAVFLVDALRQFPKGAFPSDMIYGPTPTPTLRLLTCGGTFDRSTGHYTDNLVVFAHLDQPAPASTPPPPGAAKPAAGVGPQPVGAPGRGGRLPHPQPR
jgi:hypothetical protein